MLVQFKADLQTIRCRLLLMPTARSVMLCTCEFRFKTVTVLWPAAAAVVLRQQVIKVYVVCSEFISGPISIPAPIGFVFRSL